MDGTSASEAFSRPGIDPRLWCAFGTVDQDTEQSKSVRFKDDEGNPLPTGPLVTVTLQPSGVTVVCRVAGFIAGLGEGSWYPFQEKDEVLVVFPQGSTTAGATIVARLNQEIDVFPLIVAGQDVTKNTFGFWRMRTPFIIETAESFLIRNAKTGSQIAIDPTGQVILNNGDKNNLFISSDAISLSSGDEETFMQMNFSDKRITLATGDSRMEISAEGESIWFSTGAVNIGSGGVAGKGHAVTAEQLVAFTANVICAIASPPINGFNPASAALGPTFSLFAPASLNTILSLAAAGLATPLPIGLFGAPGGNTALITAAMSALAAAISSPIPAADPTGLIPGAGRATLMF